MNYKGMIHNIVWSKGQVNIEHLGTSDIPYYQTDIHLTVSMTYHLPVYGYSILPVVGSGIMITRFKFIIKLK